MFDVDAVSLRVLRVIACVSANLLVSCGDGTGPSGGSNLFRLTTVNSMALPFRCPPSSFSGPCEVTSGELLLRQDETFTLGVDGISLLNFDGTYRRTRDSLTFTLPNGDPSQPPIVFSAAAGADSVRLDVSPPPMALLFRSRPMPVASIISATYLLTEANGRTGQPLVLSDTIISGTRYVSRVYFDSLWVTDGLFFKQHRKEGAVGYLASGDSVYSEAEGISSGSFTSSASWIVLRRYFVGVQSQRYVDSLAIGGGTLTRTTRLIRGNIVERYSRTR